MSTGKRTFRARTFQSRTFMPATWNGLGVSENDYMVDPWTVLHAQNRMDRLSMDRDDRFHAERWDSFTGDRGDA